MMEKERIMKENKKIKKQFRKKKIEFNEEIPLLDTTDIKEHYYMKRIEGMRQERREK